MPVITGLDLASSNCGFCDLAYEPDNPVWPTYKSSGRFSAKGSGFPSFAGLVRDVESHLHHRWIRLIVLEDLINNPFSYRGGDLAQVAGALKYVFYGKIPILLVHPSQAKHFVSSKRLDKWGISKAAMEMFAWTPTFKARNEIEDEMDAVILAHIGIYFIGLKEKFFTLDELKPFQREIFVSKEQVKVRRKKEVRYFTGLLQRSDLLLKGTEHVEPEAA